MKIKNICFNFNKLENIDVNVILDNEQIYIVQLIIIKVLNLETSEPTIKDYVEEDNGCWLKFCLMGTEIDDKTLDFLTDRWFVKTQ